MSGSRTNYTKSVYWFLQEIEDNLDAQLKEEFVAGGFIVRQTDTYWAGISPDRAIESTLMAGVKKN